MPNPIDLAMNTFQKAFPVDYVLLTLGIYYLLSATMHGVRYLGVRFCGFKVCLPCRRALLGAGGDRGGPRGKFSSRALNSHAPAPPHTPGV